MSDSFIESVMTPQSEKEEADTNMSREFYGMMAVQHDNYDSDSTTEGENE